MIAYRAILTGRGPDLVVGSIRRRDGEMAEPQTPWRVARDVAAELAPDVCRRMAAKAESVTGGDTAVF